MKIELQKPHYVTVPELSLGGLSPEKLAGDADAPVRAAAIVEAWASRFNGLLAGGDVDTVAAAFRSDGWLRDSLALSWDFRAIHGVDKISAYLRENQGKAQLQNVRPRAEGAFVPRVATPAPGVEWLESMIDFDTAVGSGSGMVRLVPGAGDKWEIYMLSLSLLNLNGVEEKINQHRPHGGNNSLLGGATAGNWFERRERQRNFVDQEPAVVVVGAGQAGLEIGACLSQMDVSTLIVDRNPRIGDNWRNRYRTLVTHDPVRYSHMPYFPFPVSWPTYTPKDKLADWFEVYATVMELNVWTSTTIESADFDDATQTWTVKLVRGDGSTRIFHPRHVVFATGHSGEAYVPKFPGQEGFKGLVYHTSRHEDAANIPDISSKKVVVVGSGNSGHDICQNFYENGADVTMLQRGGTYVIAVAKGVVMIHKGMYDESGPPTEEADIFANSLPFPVKFAFDVHGTERISAAEREELDGLAKAGFKLDFGLDGSGLYRKYMSRGGGYYLDVGCSRLIIEGKVKVRQSPGGISSFDADGIVLADGSKVPADVVVMATGFDSMRTTARKIVGEKVGEKLLDVWGLDDEGEINAIWRYSGHSGFWFMGGNLALCRWYSRQLALQIKAAEMGIYVAPRRPR